MSENLHDIDKLFRDSIDGHEEMPSGKVWDAIDNNLDKSNVIQIKKKYNNLKRLAIALLLLLLGTVVYEIQSKKTGKGEVVTNNADGNKVNNAPADKVADKTNTNNANNGGDKLNNAGGDKTKSNSASSNNTISNNAGKDNSNGALRNTTAPDDRTTNKKTANSTQQKFHNKTSIKTPAIDDVQDIANESPQLQQGNKSQLKKSYNHKTKITIKNGVAVEEMVTEENETEKNAANKAAGSATLNELKAPQIGKAEKITTTAQINMQVKIDEKRKSPDAISSNTLAKNKAAKNGKAFHFSIMPFYAPQYSTNRLEDDHHDPGPQPWNGREEIKRDEPNEKVYSFGVLATVPVGKKWGLQSGITYLNKEINIQPKKIYAKLDNDGRVKYRFDCSSGYTYISPKTGTTPAVGDSINAAASTNTLQYLGIPLAVTYTFSVGRFSIIPTVGTTINFLTKQKIETELIQGTTNEKQSISTIEGLKKNYFNAFTGIAFEYNVSKKLALNLTPSGNFALSSINKDAAVKSYPNSFGVAAGIKIKF